MNLLYLFCQSKNQYCTEKESKLNKKIKIDKYIKVVAEEGFEPPTSRI